MCKMTPKLLYLVFTVVITFEGTRGNVETGSPTFIKHEKEVFPSSLLFLLKRRPTSGLGYKNITPVPVSPVPLSPSAPVEPFAPLPPSIPAIPNAPVSPSIPYSPVAPVVPNIGIRPNSFYRTVRYGQNYQQATQSSSSGQLSYDNPSNGNRKILNIVHVHPRPQPLITNPDKTDNKVTEKSKDLSTNTFQINPKDIPFEPVKNIEASPIPVKPKNTEFVPSQPTNVDSGTKENKDLDGSKNSFQINPKNIPFEPVKNIEASPIPVKPKNTEFVSSQPTNVDSGTKENKDLDGSKNSFQINPKNIPFEPVKNIEASPIPVKPKNTEAVPSQPTNVDSGTKENKDLDGSKNSFQINPKNIPFEPVKNIEASPIPVKPKNTEFVPSQATNVDSGTKENKDLDGSKNSFQINPKNIPFEPVKNVEASPIPVKPKNTEAIPSQATNVDSDTKENKGLDQSTNSFQFNPIDIPFEPVKNIEVSPIPVKPKNIEVVPSQPTNVDSETKENKDLDKSKNSFEFNPNDIPFEPVNNIEASPIPVQPKNTDVVPSQATNSASPIAEASKEGKNPEFISSAGISEANATPVKSQIKPEPSEEKSAVSDSQNTPDVSSTASEYNIADEASKTEEPQNPLKDLILNGNPSNNNADKEESKKAEDSKNKADTQNGHSSSKNEDNAEETSENHEDNLNSQTTESDSTNYESPTDETHSASTYDESRFTSLPEGSHSDSTEHESEATSSDNTNSQSTDSQSENSYATDSNTESSNGPTSEETEPSENTQKKKSDTKEGISSAGIQEIPNHQGTVKEN